MSSHGGVDNNRSLIAKRGSGRDKHRKGHRGGGKTSTQTSGSGQGRSSHDDNSRGKRSQFLSREKKRVNLVNPMLGFGYDRNGSYITPKVSSITLASMMATEGFSESESEDDCSYLTDLAHKTHGDKRSTLQKLLLHKETLDPSITVVDGDKLLKPLSFKTILPAKFLVTKKYCVHDDLPNVVRSKHNPNIWIDNITFEHYLKGPGSEEWRKALGFAIRDSFGNPVWNDWGNIFGVPYIKDGDKFRWDLPIDDPGLNFIKAMTRIWVEFALRGLRPPEPHEGVKCTFTNVTGIVPYGPSLSSGRVPLQLYMDYEVIYKSAISYEFHNARLNAFLKDALFDVPSQPPRLISGPPGTLRSSLSDREREIEKQMDASASSRSKEKTVAPTDLPPESGEREPPDNDDENGDDQSSTTSIDQSVEETADPSAQSSQYEDLEDELPSSNASSEADETDYDSDFTVDSNHSGRRRRRRRSPNRDKGQSRPSTRKHVDDPRNTSPGVRKSIRSFSIGIPADKEYVLSLFEGDGVPKLVLLREYRRPFPKFYSNSNNRAALNIWLQAMADVILAHNMSENDVMPYKFEFLDESSLNQVSRAGSHTWREMVMVLITNYFTEVSLYNAQIAFSEATQGPDETAPEFMRRLRDLAGCCNLIGNNITLRIRFFTGLRASLRNDVMRMSDGYIDNFDGFFNLVVRTENKIDSVSNKPTGQPSGNINPQPITVGAVSNTAGSGQTVLEKKGDKYTVDGNECSYEESIHIARVTKGSTPNYGANCSRCGSSVHLSPECPIRYSITCEYCFKPGHLGAACNIRRRDLSQSRRGSSSSFYPRGQPRGFPAKRTVSDRNRYSKQHYVAEDEEGGEYDDSKPQGNPPKPPYVKKESSPAGPPRKVYRISIQDHVPDTYPSDATRHTETKWFPQVADAAPMGIFNRIKRGEHEFVYVGKGGTPAPYTILQESVTIATTRIIPKSAMVAISIGGIPLEALADSGAAVACIPESKVPPGATIYPSSGMLEVADGTKHEYQGSTVLDVYLDGYAYPCHFQIVPDFMKVILLGANFFWDNDIVIDLREGLRPPNDRRVVKFLDDRGKETPRAPLTSHSVVLTDNHMFQSGETKLCRVHILGGPWVKVNGIIEPSVPFTDTTALSNPCVSSAGVMEVSQEMYIPVTNYRLQPAYLHGGASVGLFKQIEQEAELMPSWLPLTDPSMMYGGNHLFTNDIVPLLPKGTYSVKAPLTEKSSTAVAGSQELEALLAKYKAAFYETKNRLHATSLIQHEIVLNDDTPVFRPNYPLSHDDLTKLSDIVEEMVKEGWIEEACSDYNAPIVMVRKPNGEVRFCNDFRGLNAVTVQDRWSPPRADEILMSLAGKKLFSKIDLKHGFYQIAIKPEHRRLTAFTAPNVGQYQYIRMPFGLMNAPATFCRLMHKVLSDITYFKVDGKVVSVIHSYIDDILIASDSLVNHLAHIEILLARLVEHNLSANPKKCSFLQKEVAFLGHLVSGAGIRPDPEKVRAIQLRAKPTNYKEVRSFLGLMGYYHSFIKGFTTLAAPLRALEAEGAQFLWTDTEQLAFEKLKASLSEATLKAHPDFTRPFIIYSDASDLGLGCALHQEQNGIEVPIAFGGRVLTPAEKGYSTSEKECLGLYFALKTFHPFIHMKKILIRTDHRALQFLLSRKYSDNSRLRSWVNLIGVYLPEIHYVPGAALPNVDSISRQSYLTSEPETLLCNELLMSVIMADSEMAISQCSDSEIGQIWKSLSMNEVVEGYVLLDNLVHRVVDGVPKLWVPKAKRVDLLNEAHDGLFGGHRGERVTRSRLQQDFWWEGLTLEVKEYVSNCVSCSANKLQTPAIPHPSFRRTTNSGLRSFEKIVIDVKGPVDLTKHGNRFLITFVDLSTRWVEAFATPDHSAHTVARVLVEEIFTRHGSPSLIISDQGADFMSNLFQEVVNLIGTKHRYNPTYTPWTQGAIERVHGSLSEIISHYIRNSTREWDQVLPYALAAYRTAVHSSTGYAPFELLYGRKPVNPYNKGFLGKPPPGMSHEDLDKLIGDDLSNRSAAKKWLLETKCNLSLMRDAITLAEEASGSLTPAKEVTFHPGDHVAIKTKNRPKSNWSKDSLPLFGKPAIVVSDNGNVLRLKDLHSEATFNINKRHVKRVNQSTAESLSIIEGQLTVSKRGPKSKRSKGDTFVNSETIIPNAPNLPAITTGSDSAGLWPAEADKDRTLSSSSLPTHSNVGEFLTEGGVANEMERISLGQEAVSSDKSHTKVTEAATVTKTSSGKVHPLGKLPVVWHTVIPKWSATKSGSDLSQSENSLDGSPNTPRQPPSHSPRQPLRLLTDEGELKPSNCTPLEIPNLLSNNASSLASEYPRDMRKAAKLAAKFLGIHDIFEHSVDSQGRRTFWCQVYDHRKDWLTWVSEEYFSGAKEGSKTLNLLNRYLLKYATSSKTSQVSTTTVASRYTQSSTSAEGQTTRGSV